MNGERERGAVGVTRVTFYAFMILYLRFLIGFVCLKTIMVAPKQLTRIIIELREGEKNRDRQNVLGVTVHFTFTITRWVVMGCDVQFDGVKSFFSLWIFS